MQNMSVCVFVQVSMDFKNKVHDRLFAFSRTEFILLPQLFYNIILKICVLGYTSEDH